MAEASFEDSMRAFGNMNPDDLIGMIAGVTGLAVEEVDAERVTETQEYFREVTGKDKPLAVTARFLTTADEAALSTASSDEVGKFFTKGTFPHTVDLSLLEKGEA